VPSSSDSDMKNSMAVAVGSKGGGGSSEKQWRRETFESMGGMRGRRLKREERPGAINARRVPKHREGSRVQIFSVASKQHLKRNSASSTECHLKRIRREYS
jgi:hypothetical protein